MISIYKRKVGDKKLKTCKSFKVGSWVKVTDPSREELDHICKEYNLDKRNVLSGLDDNEIPRLDIIGENTYIFTKEIFNLKRVQTLLIVIGKSFILTLSKSEVESLNRILKEKIEFFTTQRMKCLIRILFLLNEDFEKATRETVKAIRIKKHKNKDLNEKELEELLEREDFLNTVVSYYNYISSLYSKVIKRLNFFKQDEELLRDLIEEIEEGLNLSKSSLKNISNIRDHYVVLLSNKLNKIITIFTIFTILISLPAAISGIYGMNIPLPLQGNPFAFHYVFLGIVISWIIFFSYLKKIRVI